jgi:hypothetical protein
VLWKNAILGLGIAQQPWRGITKRHFYAVENSRPGKNYTHHGQDWAPKYPYRLWWLSQIFINNQSLTKYPSQIAALARVLLLL